MLELLLQMKLGDDKRSIQCNYGRSHKSDKSKAGCPDMLTSLVGLCTSEFFNRLISLTP